MQDKISHYMLYVRSLFISLSEEYETHEIHVRRIISVLKRLFEQEDEQFLKFFNVEEGKQKKSMQLITLMCNQGELFSVGNGYYSLFPPRIIYWPLTNEYVGINIPEKINVENYYGLHAMIVEPEKLQYPVVDIKSFAYSPSTVELLESYHKKMSERKIIVNDCKVFTGGKEQFTQFFSVADNQFFIAYHRLENAKPEKYLAIKKRGKLFNVIIDELDYSRILFALRKKFAVKVNFEVKKLNDDLIEVQINRLLPPEELRLISLLAMPECFKGPKKFYVYPKQLENIKCILMNLHFKEMSRNGVHN